MSLSRKIAHNSVAIDWILASQRLPSTLMKVMRPYFESAVGKSYQARCLHMDHVALILEWALYK